jgi:hypothetical protein
MVIQVAGEREKRGKMSVAEAGHRGGEKVRRLIREGEARVEREAEKRRR